MSRCEQAEVRSDELRLCHSVFAIKVRDWGIIIRQHFSLRDLLPRQIFCRVVFFRFISRNIWFGTSFLPAALRVLFSSILVCRCSFHKGGFAMAAFGILLQCPSAQHQYCNNWPMPLLDHLSVILDNLVLLLCVNQWDLQFKTVPVHKYCPLLVF